MKTLHIHRHAKSSWKHNLRDHDRPLNKRGKTNVEFMASLFSENHTIDLIVSSTAKRAHSTATVFAKALGIRKKDIVLQPLVYAAAITDLMQVVNTISDEYSDVMIFGHNPGLSYLVEYLDSNFRSHLVTCARVTLVFEVDSWQAIGNNSGQVTEHDYPRKYPEMADL